MPIEKSNLHSRNLHRNAYDFAQLIISVPELKQYVFVNAYQTLTIDFSLPKAVRLLNKALLSHYYNVKNWDIPEANLCPPIPGRADYIHYLADLLAEQLETIPTGMSVKGLDIGVGANIAYPLIATRSYGWQMLGSDINQESLENARQILDHNPDLSSAILLKKQPDCNFIFKNIIDVNDKFMFSMCNPPFHDSKEAMIKGNLRKIKNLTKSKLRRPSLNFGGQQSELWCEGGELAFISKMIIESVLFGSQVLWFTTLVSRKDHLPKFIKMLKEIKVSQVKIIDMAQGQKVSRILVWTFMPVQKHKNWLL